MKDKNLRKALGIHGSGKDLCACSILCNVTNNWQGELPEIWKRIEKLEAKIEAIEAKKKKKA